MIVVGAILAAGASTRLGHAKQLVAIDGEPLLHRTARVALASPCARVAVVVGAAREAVATSIADLDVDVLDNLAWPEGMGASLRVAAAWAAARRCDGLLVMVCDQPRLTTAHLADLAARFTGDAVASSYAGQRGVPAIVPRAAFPALAELRGDRGARALLRDAATIAWDDGAIDVDEPGDL